MISPEYISAYIVHRSSQGPRYLMMRRCGAYLPGTWQMVTGGILQGETAVQAALREVREETGIDQIQLYCADAVETFYMQTLDKVVLVPVFVGFVEEISVKLSRREHDAYEWLSFEEARARLVWAEQQRVLSHIHENCVLKRPHDLLLADMTLQSPPANKLVLSRTGVYGIALQNGKLLVIKQQKGPYKGKFDLPGGGIEVRETVEQALRREFEEEVGMTFDSMQFIENLTASTEDISHEGKTCLFHQIGMIYLVRGVSLLENKFPELEYYWIEIEDLAKQTVSPFVEQVKRLLRK